jgi:hypothetical protein
MKWLVLIVAMWAAWAARAHPLHASVVALELHDDDVVVHLQIPLTVLTQVVPQTTSSNLTEATALVRERLTLHTPTASAFAMTWHLAQVVDVDGAPHLLLTAVARPPVGASARAFTLTDTAIIDTIDEHRIYVEVRRDFAAGVLHEPQLVGVLSSKEPSIVVDRGAGSWLTGARAVFQLGRHHIADGTDHLLFLLVLLVPAAVRARAGRWHEPSTTKQALLQMLGVVSAFTVGHSITLALAALDVVRVPSTPVEVVIAVSILVSAVHAWRPLFAGREHVVAGAFGIVHGLAFATTLADLGVQGRALWLSLLAFNVGIEVQQLLIVAATMPWLLVLSRTRLADGVRAGLALVAAVAAIAWTVERVFDVATPVTAAVEAVAAHGWWVLLVLSTTSLLAWWRQRR